MWSVLALGIVCAASGSSPSEAPAPPPASPADPFQWNAPAECPPASEVRASVEAHLGIPLSQLPDGSWSVVGTISSGADRGWAVDLVVHAPDGPTERTLHDPSDCAAVSDAAALLIAIAIDPDAVTASEPIASEPDAGRADAEVSPASDDAGEAIVDVAPETPPPPPSPRPTPAPPREPPLHFVLGAAGGLDWGTLRGVSPIGRASFAWQLPRMRIGVNAMFGVAPGFGVPSVSRDISLWMWTAGAEAGPVFHAGAFEFPLTAGLEAGQIVIRPRDLLPPPRQQVTWAALLVTPGVAWVPLPWLAVVARVGATVSLVRPGFSIQGVGRIAAPAPAGIRATLGLEFRFPLTVMKTAAAGNLH